MIVEIKSPAEAFVGVGLIVLAADGELSDKEARTVFDSLMSLGILVGDAGMTARRFLGQMIGLLPGAW
jgi:tellurite resistance protein